MHETLNWFDAQRCTSVFPRQAVRLDRARNLAGLGSSQFTSLRACFHITHMFIESQCSLPTEAALNSME